MENVIVITGSTSMIGTAIIRDYLAHGVKTIYALTRPSSTHLHRLPLDDRIIIRECAPADYPRLHECITEKCDVFFHLAWDGTGIYRKTDIVNQARNITYTLDALSAAKKLGCRKFIGSGSQAEFGTPSEFPLREESPTQPIEPYGVTKLAAGQLAMMQAQNIGIDCFWVRVFSVFGIYDKPSSMISYAIERMSTGKRASFTPAQHYWDYLYCDDAGSAFRHIAERSTGQKTYCLGSGSSRQLFDYISSIKSVVNPKAEIGIGDIPYKEIAPINLQADISRLSQDTNWKPLISFEEGIAIICKHKGLRINRPS